MQRAVEEHRPPEAAQPVPDSSRGTPVTVLGPTEHRSPRARAHVYLVLCPLMILLVMWLWLFRSEGAFDGGPNGKAFEADLAMYLGAAQILKQGGNPYDTTLLYQTERSSLSRQGLPITEQRAIVRVGNPPLFLWALEPLTRFRFQVVALSWMVFLSALTLVGFLGCLRYLGWRRWLFPCAFFALMPQVIFGPFYGNFISLAFAGVGVGLALLKKHPFAAGMVLSLALLKPPVATPIVLLILLFHPLERRRAAAGFGLASLSLFLLTIPTAGWASLQHWPEGLLGYSRHINVSPDVASLAGLYVRLTPEIPRASLQLLCLTLASALTAYWGWQHRASRETPLLVLSWLWFIWFLATPYAHFYDEILLTVPILVLLGRDGFRVGWRLPSRALYLMFFSILFISFAPYQIQLLPVPLLMVTVILVTADLNPRYRAT